MKEAVRIGPCVGRVEEISVSAVIARILAYLPLISAEPERLRRRSCSTFGDRFGYHRATFVRQRFDSERRIVAGIDEESSVGGARMSQALPGGVRLNRREGLLRARLYPPDPAESETHDPIRRPAA